MLKRISKYNCMFRNCNDTGKKYTNYVRNLHVSKGYCSERKTDKSIVQTDQFDTVEKKNKNSYLEMVKIFVNRDHVYRRGHVEFIYSAMKNMEQFGVHKDLEVYKALIDILPKGKFIPSNLIQAEFMHYPKQQQCIIDLLEQMEDNGVIPDYDMEDLLINIFGRQGYPVRRYWRMMYWMPKFKNLSPWPIPDPIPTDVFDLARYAIDRISSADETSEVKVYYTAEVEDSIDDTWIVSAQSPSQKCLLSEHEENDPIFVEGSFKVWIKEKAINYFVLRGQPKPVVDDDVDLDNVSNLRVSLFNIKPPVGKHLKTIPSVHEQDDGVIFAVCATGTSSKDSLLSWIRHLEKDGNPKLSTIPIVFTLKSGSSELATSVDSEDKNRIENQ